MAEEKSARQLQIDRQKTRAASVRQSAAQTVRVHPATDEMRKLLKHPTGKIGFPAQGSVEWPNDSFTRRRIAEGSVTIEA